MNSSISSSEGLGGKTPSGRAWLRFARLLALTVPGLALAFLALAFVLDPYDTGRPGLIGKPGVRPQGPRTAAASRGRDPAFNAAIFGNSHVQLLSPENLAARTGQRFVSLIAPATHPKEQLVLLDWFSRNQKEQAAIIIGIDGNWCTGNPALPNEKPFPYWLYDRSLLVYTGGLLRFDLLEEIPRRIGYLLSRTPKRARPDGFWNYEADYIQLGYDKRPDRRARLEKRHDAMPSNPGGPFPAADRLAKALATIPGHVRVILLQPPVFVTALPVSGSAEDQTDKACKAAFATVANRRPYTAIIDWRRDTPEVRDPALWFDHTHYRLPLAARIEASIAATLRSLE